MTSRALNVAIVVVSLAILAILVSPAGVLSDVDIRVLAGGAVFLALIGWWGLRVVSRPTRAAKPAARLSRVLLGTANSTADTVAPQRPRAFAARKPFELGTGAGFTVGIVGESYRQTALRAIAAGRRRRGEEVVIDATVYAEVTNAYDPNAVRVDDVNGQHLGYLSREDAAAYRDLFGALHSKGRVGHCRAKLIGGTAERPSIGVILDLEEHTELSARLAAEDQPF